MKIVIVFCFVNIFSNIVYSQIVPSPKYFFEQLQFQSKISKVKKSIPNISEKIIDYSKLSKLSTNEKLDKELAKSKEQYIHYTVDTSIQFLV